MPRGLTVPYITDADVQLGASPIIAADLESLTSTRIFYTDWLNAGIACYELLGYPILNVSDPAEPFIQRYLPQFDPDFPWAVATKILNVKGVGARGYYVANGLRAANYELAKITVEFSMPDYDIIADEYMPEDRCEFDRYRTFVAKPAAEYLSIPLQSGPGQLKWSDPNDSNSNPFAPHLGRPFPGNVGFIIGNIDYHWEWIQVPFEALPVAAAQDIVGCVNATEFADCAAGTLLLTAWEPVRKNSPYGLRTWRVGYTARYNNRLHNNFYDWAAEVPGFYQASTDGVYYDPETQPDDGKLLYNSREFRDLFTPPALV